MSNLDRFLATLAELEKLEKKATAGKFAVAPGDGRSEIFVKFDATTRAAGVVEELIGATFGQTLEEDRANADLFAAAKSFPLPVVRSLVEVSEAARKSVGNSMYDDTWEEPLRTALAALDKALEAGR